MDKVYSLDDSTSSSLPKCVEELLEVNKVQIESSLDLLAVILHCLMLESGFCDEKNKPETSQSDSKMLQDDVKSSQNDTKTSESHDNDIFELCDKSSSVYRFKYSLDRDPEMRSNCVLVVTTVGPVVTASGKCQNTS